MPAIPYQKTPTTNAPWDGPAAKKDLKLGQDKAYYEKEFAWIDPNGDPTTKEAYKFPHHQVSTDGTIGDANLDACQAAIDIMNGADGGSQIPAGDHQAVYDHLAHHLKDANPDKDVTPLKKANDPKDLKRFVTIAKVNFRAATADAPAMISGYASVFNSLSEPLWEYGGGCEMIAPGAFVGVLDISDVRCLINHDPNLVLGRNKSGTLALSEDATGLAFTCSLPNTTFANDLAESMRRGDVTGCSFAFQINDSDMQTINGQQVVVIRTVSDLSDVSVVTYPAYTAATASIRSTTNKKAPCPCGSGKRYKKCCSSTRNLYFKAEEVKPEVVRTTPPATLARARELELLAIE